MLFTLALSTVLVLGPAPGDPTTLHNAQCDYQAHRITTQQYLERTKGLHADENDPNQYSCTVPIQVIPNPTYPGTDAVQGP